MFDLNFIFIVLLYGIASYFYGHQASHLMHIRAGQAELNPTLTLILSIYGVLYLPWLVLLWIGYSTTWYFPLLVMLFSLPVRLALISIQSNLNLTKDAWAISLIGIVTVPIALLTIIFIVNNI